MSWDLIFFYSHNKRYNSYRLKSEVLTRFSFNDLTKLDIHGLR